MSPSIRSRDGGSMLLSVIFIILVMAALMTGLARLSGQSSQQLVYEAQALNARLAAESALERKVFELLADINASAAVTTEIRGCAAEAETGPRHTVDETGTIQINVVAKGSCSTGPITVIRNIEVEVIE
ncbi:hypothetical protein [Zobellella aerophila]|uniref:Type 4 fimbrial biogenesis protein PilX N-terminal domain-containing protein n=1 Tax=Zobellella aerophila TaxID=870480 RepID=A0ABP6V7S2_9GAMM